MEIWLAIYIEILNFLDRIEEMKMMVEVSLTFLNTQVVSLYLYSYH